MGPFPAQRTGVYRNIKLEELVDAKVGRFVLYATEWHRMDILHIMIVLVSCLFQRCSLGFLTEANFRVVMLCHMSYS